MRGRTRADPAGLPARAAYMVCRRPFSVGEQRKAPAGRSGMAVGGEAAWGGNGDAIQTIPGPDEHGAGLSGTVQRAVGVSPQARASLGALRRADGSFSMAAPLELQARLELDSKMVGTYMRDAIGRGGYREALEYYGSDESKKSDRPWRRFKARGWLLGRLGHYAQMSGWLEEGVALPDFDLLLSTAHSAPRATYRTPALWMETPSPVQLRAGRMMAFEPVAAACRDMGTVPDDVWAVALILEAAGPICSHAGLGAALSLVAAGADRQAAGPTRRNGRYDPLHGAQLHGAPVGCHRWIIADIDFSPHPSNGPHYYYDLTDEGRGALAAARAAGAPWQKATEAAAAGLGGMALPDMLENACGLGGPGRDLGRMRADLARLVDAWRAQDDGMPASPVCAEDQALADLGSTARWFESGETVGSPLDYLLYLIRVVDSTRAVACEAEPSTGAERAVLQTLIAAIQDLCRKHGRALASAASQAGPTPTPRGDSAGRGIGMRRPRYADVTPAMISDLYYCLAEYCKSRRLAVDPCSLPLSEALAGDRKAAVIAVLADDSVFHHGTD